MTITRKPGIYFDEETTTQSTYDGTSIPFYIIQATGENTQIASLDDKITYVENFDAFKELTTNKGLTRTVDYIEDIILESGIPVFYVYKITQDTTTAFTNILVESANYPEIQDATYIEETKSSNSNTLVNKIGAFKNGLKSNANNGVFRELYVIPYGTINDAITNKTEGKTDQEAVIETFTELTTAKGSGRLCLVMPDGNAGYIVGHCIGSEYNEGVDYIGLDNVDTTNILKFDATQELALVNKGVLILSRETVQGVDMYRIYLGVTSSFKEDSSDGYIRARRICDELLRQFKFRAEILIKGPTLTTQEDLETILTEVVGNFTDAGDITADGTVLEVAEKEGEQVFSVKGKIATVKPLLIIEVDTILQ